ncbi:nucleotide-diphospho-sugar transferase family protein [Tasmannia lanceolata]|uniref:nucleotide-diphospho-sugar transferase family protein n=1 Tax=Tasmannia lanceolata TaxID=3420 RepID=UPI004062EB62
MKTSLLSSMGYSKVSLWSIWLTGLLLILLSLYSTQRLPSLREHIKKPNLTHKGFRSSGHPNITIFSAPSPFEGLVGARQSLAIRSWLALSPKVNIVLFGQHPSIFSFATSLGSRVSVESAIDFTFLGTPFFHSMVARSRSSNSDISILIDPETILFPDIISTLHHAHKLEHDWLLFAMPADVAHFPFHLDETGHHWLRENGERINIKKLQEFLIREQQWSNCTRVLMAWNPGELPLHAGVLPPFLYGKGLHHQWVINEALSSDFRFIFDASKAISSYYPENLGRWPNQFFKGIDSGGVGEKTWEHGGNSHLAALYGSFYFHPTNFSINLVKLVKCDGQYLFINTAKAVVYPVSSQEQRRMYVWKGRILRSGRKKKWTACIEDSNLVDRKIDCPVIEFSKVAFKLSRQLFLPFSLESLLHITADKDKSVVLAVAGNNYRDMLMSWVCRLRHLSISNFVVCALDPEIYQFSVLQGLPVFKDSLAPSSISFNDCHFGTKCFQRVTKVKSRLVLQILKLGYNVLLSDVDVYWFENPLPFLRSFGPAVLVAQSDEYNETGPINLPHRLNSGFYYAQSDNATIVAMEKVVKHASASDLSEQPSFYNVLCGEGGVNRISGDKCLEPETNLTVHFLDRNRFPNGAYRGLWEKGNVRAACKKKGCLILHNNWISGRKKKLERQVLSGLWEYDVSTRLCLHS